MPRWSVMDVIIVQVKSQSVPPAPSVITVTNINILQKLLVKVMRNNTNKMITRGKML